MNEFLEFSIDSLNIEQYSNINIIKKYISNTKIRVYESLTLDGDLNLDWNEDNKDCGAIFIENDLKVKGNINNFGHGGIALYVLGTTHAKNLISTGSLMFLSSVFIENIFLGAYSEGLVETQNLSAKLLINDNHSITIKGNKRITFTINRDFLSREEEEMLSSLFVRNTVLKNFIYQDDEELFLDFSSMVNPSFFNGKEDEILKEIVKCLEEIST